jgi:hypothetical protein
MERVEETGQLSFLCACWGKTVELKTSAAAGRVMTDSIGHDDFSAASGIAC